MVCINASDPEESGSPDDLSPAETLLRLHQIRRDAVANERDLRKMIAAAAISGGEAEELTQRLTTIKVLASALLNDGGTDC